MLDTRVHHNEEDILTTDLEPWYQKNDTKTEKIEKTNIF